VDLETVLNSVESDEIKEAIVSLINVEKEKGISAYRDKDREVLTWKSHAKDLGWDSTKYSNVDEWKTAIKNTDKKVSDSTLTIAQLNDKLNSYVKELELERENTRTIQKKSKEHKLQAELTNKIGADFYGSEFMIKNMISEGMADIDNDSIVIRDGDKVMDIDSGILFLKEKYKDSLKSHIKSGSGVTGGEKLSPTKEPSFAEQLKARLTK